MRGSSRACSSSIGGREAARREPGEPRGDARDRRASARELGSLTAGEAVGNDPRVAPDRVLPVPVGDRSPRSRGRVRDADRGRRDRVRSRVAGGRVRMDPTPPGRTVTATMVAIQAGFGTAAAVAAIGLGRPPIRWHRARSSEAGRPRSGTCSRSGLADPSRRSDLAGRRCRGSIGAAIGASDRSWRRRRSLRPRRCSRFRRSCHRCLPLRRR